MSIAVDLQPEGTPRGHAYVAQPQIRIDEIDVVVQAFAVRWLQVCLVRLFVVPRFIAATGLHGRQNAHQPGLISSLVQQLLHPLLLTEPVLLLRINSISILFSAAIAPCSPEWHRVTVLPTGDSQRCGSGAHKSNPSCPGRSTTSEPFLG